MYWTDEPGEYEYYVYPVGMFQDGSSRTEVRQYLSSARRHHVSRCVFVHVPDELADEVAAMLTATLPLPRDPHDYF